MTSLEFAELARRLSSALRSSGLEVPSFRSPPRSPRLSRSLSRQVDGSCTVSVRLRSRSSLAVTADMIDGAVAANRLAGETAGRLRDELWAAAEAILNRPQAALSAVSSEPESSRLAHAVRAAVRAAA